MLKNKRKINYPVLKDGVSFRASLFSPKAKIKGGILAAVGYLLSPFSWWNDLILNIPLAYGFGFLFGLISKQLFLPMVVVGYWITNILGLVLMQHGIKGVVSKGENVYSRKDFLRDILLSIIYTFGIAILIRAGWLKFPTEYFNQ